MFRIPAAIKGNQGKKSRAWELQKMSSTMPALESGFFRKGQNTEGRMPMKDSRELMPEINECEAEECAFNGNGSCQAIAINVGGPADVCPNCDTFMEAAIKGGIPGITAGVGVCKVQDCRYNSNLECNANSVSIKLHSNHADCATYQSL
jgi:hypothetical protein